MLQFYQTKKSTMTFSSFLKLKAKPNQKLKNPSGTNTSCETFKYKKKEERTNAKISISYIPLKYKFIQLLNKNLIFMKKS